MAVKLSHDNWDKGRESSAKMVGVVMMVLNGLLLKIGVLKV